jgi:hypothetical protein
VALLALLAISNAAAPVVADTLHDPCPRGCIVAPGLTYAITRDNLVWTARMANCEIANVTDTDDAPATMWALVTNFVRRREAGRAESFGGFVQTYSGCTSKRWATGGDRYSPRITPIADVNRRLRWSQIPQRVRDFVRRFFRAEWPNRWPGWCWVWTRGWERMADPQHIGPYYAVEDAGQSLNAYYADPATVGWAADRIRIVGPRWD